MVASYAQWSQDLVLAKYRDGSTYIGEKISESDGIINIRIITRDTIQIDRRFAKKVFDSNNAIIFSNGKYFETKGLFFDFSIGFNLFSEAQGVSSHLDFILGYRLRPGLDVGIGLGSEFNEAKAAGFTFDTQFSSTFLYARYFVNKNRCRVFPFGRIGYGAAAEEQQEGIPNEYNGGIHIMYGLGLDFAAKKSARFQLHFGHYLQKTNGREFFLDNLGNEVETNFDLMLSRFIIKFGVEFSWQIQEIITFILYYFSIPIYPGLLYNIPAKHPNCILSKVAKNHQNWS